MKYIPRQIVVLDKGERSHNGKIASRSQGINVSVHNDGNLKPMKKMRHV